MTDLPIRSILYKNYKNLITDCRINFKPLNILIGPNASGKSNLINILEFFKNSVLEPEESASGTTRFDTAVIRLGSDHILDRSVKMPGVVQLGFEFPGRKSGDAINLDLELFVQGTNKKVIINSELLYRSQEGVEPFYFYKAHDRNSGSGVFSVYISGGPQTHFQPLNQIPVDEMTLVSLPRLLESSLFPPESTPAFQMRRHILDLVSSWRFYNANDMNLQAIRLAEPRLGPSDIFLSSSGENLPLVLENLTQNDIDFDDKLNEAMREILPWTHRVRATRSGRLSLIAEWHLAPPGKPKEQYYLSDMSDGSVRMLCWACVLLSPQLPSLLVIEEPEIGIHVAWLKTLVHWIKQAASRTQVIITTHSPDLLDHFTDELENVMVMEQSEKQIARFCVRGLDRNALAPQLSEGWQLGDLYRIGDPIIGGWPW